MSNKLHLSQHQQLLCDVLANTNLDVKSDAVQRLWQGLGDKLVFELDETNQVGSNVAHALIDSFGLANVSSRWCKAHDKTHKRISAYLLELDRIADKCSQEGIPLVALKNAGIARGIFSCPGCCPMSDLDVLVERYQFRKAHQVLLDEGYHFEFRSPLEEAELKAAEESGGAEYWKLLPEGEKLWFELQWRPVAGRWIRPDQEPSTEELMARSIPIEGTVVRLLSPEDNLLQVSLHTAKHTYVRAPGFRLHLDVERIVCCQKIDWGLFVRRVIKLQVKTAVYFSLLIPYELFKTPIPEHVLDSLRPAAWKERLIVNWLNRVGLFNPDEKKFGRVGYIVFNALLYDDVFGFFKGVFPERKWMKEHYEFNNNLLLPFYHGKRIMNLALKRLQT